MFDICRAYLVDVVKNQLGITNVGFTRGDAAGTRQARIFTMPNRGVLEKQYTRQQEVIRYYTDPNDCSPARLSGTTDAAGNEGSNIIATGADFVAAGVIPDDYFINDRTNRRSKIFEILSETELVLQTSDGVENSVAFHISPKNGKAKQKTRIVKAEQRLTFVVEFTNQNILKANEDFLNFNRKIGSFIYDGQFAQLIDKDGNVETDSKGNKIQVIVGAYEFGDNQFYPELTNKIVQEIQFVGGIFITPDAATGLVEVAADWVAPVVAIETE